MERLGGKPALSYGADVRAGNRWEFQARIAMAEDRLIQLARVAGVEASRRQLTIFGSFNDGRKSAVRREAAALRPNELTWLIEALKVALDDPRPL